MADGEQTSAREQRLRRLLGGAEAGPEAILYQHSILCQTGLPGNQRGRVVHPRFWCSWMEHRAARRDMRRASLEV